MVHGPYLRAAGEEGLDVDVGVVHLQVMVAETTRDANGCHDAGLRREVNKMIQKYLKINLFLSAEGDTDTQTATQEGQTQ